MGEKTGFGQFIAKRREFMHLTQEEMAQMIGVSKSAVAKWETEGGLPDRDNLKRLSKVINVSVDDLHRIIERGCEESPEMDINITADVIAALESYGYQIFPPMKKGSGERT